MVALTCISLLFSGVEHLSMDLLAICMSSVEKRCVQIFCPYFNRIVWGFLLLRVLCMFWILTPYQIHDLQILSPIRNVAFSFCPSSHLPCRSFIVGCRSTCLFLLLLLVLLVLDFKYRHQRIFDKQKQTSLANTCVTFTACVLFQGFYGFRSF